jgi:hypothetical protein
VFPEARATAFGEPADFVPARDRVRLAIERDLGAAGPIKPRLLAAWTRIAELRLPGSVLTPAAQDEIDRLVALWDHHPRPGGIQKQVYGMTEAACEAEADRLRALLAILEHAAEGA